MLTKETLAKRIRNAKNDEVRRAFHKLLVESLGNDERAVYLRVLAGDMEAPVIALRVKLSKNYASNVLRRLAGYGLVVPTGKSLGRVQYEGMGMLVETT